MLEERKMREEIAEKLLFTCMCSGVTGCNVRREEGEGRNDYEVDIYLNVF